MKTKKRILFEDLERITNQRSIWIQAAFLCFFNKYTWPQEQSPINRKRPPRRAIIGTRKDANNVVLEIPFTYKKLLFFSRNRHRRNITLLQIYRSIWIQAAFLCFLNKYTWPQEQSPINRKRPPFTYKKKKINKKSQQKEYNFIAK